MHGVELEDTFSTGFDVTLGIEMEQLKDEIISIYQVLLRQMGLVCVY